MASYRLYRASDVTRRFEPAHEFDAEHDQAAIVIADEVRSRRPAELWNGSRIVREWKG